MKAKHILRPHDLAKASGLSTQGIRNYEKVGFIPAVAREAQGYRYYTQQHLQALKVARFLITSYGWKYAQRIMSALHAGDLPKALAAVDERHAEIHHQRQELEETLRILRTTSETLPKFREVKERPWLNQTALTIGEVAERVGVRTSAIRFWEEQELITPERDHDNRYRKYSAEQVRDIQVIALLRKANYNFDAIRAVLNQLATGTPDQAVAAAEKRLKELAEVSKRCLEASATLWTYIRENIRED